VGIPLPLPPLRSLIGALHSARGQTERTRLYTKGRLRTGGSQTLDWCQRRSACLPRDRRLASPSAYSPRSLRRLRASRDFGRNVSVIGLECRADTPTPLTSSWVSPKRVGRSLLRFPAPLSLRSTSSPRLTGGGCVFSRSLKDHGRAWHRLASSSSVGHSRRVRGGA
jgi:hypothetical protein